MCKRPRLCVSCADCVNLTWVRRHPIGLLIWTISAPVWGNSAFPSENPSSVSSTCLGEQKFNRIVLKFWHRWIVFAIVSSVPGLGNGTVLTALFGLGGRVSDPWSNFWPSHDNDFKLSLAIWPNFHHRLLLNKIRIYQKPFSGYRPWRDRFQQFFFSTSMAESLWPKCAMAEILTAIFYFVDILFYVSPYVPTDYFKFNRQVWKVLLS